MRRNGRYSTQNPMICRNGACLERTMCSLYQRPITNTVEPTRRNHTAQRTQTNSQQRSTSASGTLGARYRGSCTKWQRGTGDSRRTSISNFVSAVSTSSATDRACVSAAICLFRDADRFRPHRSLQRECRCGLQEERGRRKRGLPVPQADS